MKTGRRSRRFAPTKDAVMAARMSTASRPSRNTRTAEFVTTVALFALSPSVAAASPRASSRTRRVSCTCRRAARLAMSSASPCWSRAPNQMRPSTSIARPGSNAFSRRSGPNSKNAYASRRACSAFLYSAAPTAASIRSSVSAMRS